jgi:hypothetical protein
MFFIPHITEKMRGLKLKGTTLPKATHWKCVGAHLCAASTEQATLSNDKVNESCASAERIQRAPLPWDSRTALTTALVLPHCTFGCSVTPLTGNQERKLRQASLKAIWGRRQSRRCAEIVLTLFAPSHRVDPRSASQFQALVAMHKVLTRHTELHETFVRAWQNSIGRQSAHGGPVSTIGLAVNQMNWVWTSAFVFKTAEGNDVEPLKLDGPQWAHIV